MSNELVKTETASNPLRLTQGAWEEFKKLFGKGKNGIVATDDEMMMFAGLCASTKLNPYTREIWLIPSVTRNNERTTIIMTGIAGLRRVANEHPQYDGMSEPEVTFDPLDKKLPYFGKVAVYRKDRSRPEVASLFFSEVARMYEGKLSGRWATSPYQQFVKCLEAATLRKAFPILSGAYLQEEIGYDERTGKVAELVVESPQKRLERKFSEWAGNEPQVVANMPEESEPQAEEQRSPKKIFTYSTVGAGLSEDKIEQARLYAEKLGARARLLDGDLFVEHVSPLPKLANYEIGVEA